MLITIADMLRRAANATDPHEARRHLLDAAAAIEQCHDARQVLHVASQLAAPSEAELRALVERTLQLALVEHEVWGIRDAAAVLANRLADHEAALAALVEGERAMAREGVPGHVWVLLARGFAEIVADHEGASRCLLAARAQAEHDGNLADRCTVAGAWAELLDRAEGRAQLELVEPAALEPSAAWSLANAWNALGEPSAARRVLERALEHARTCTDSLMLVHAWASHQLPSDALRALEQAATQAERFDEWLEIAAVATLVGLGEPAIRRALAQAELRAGDADARMQLANAYATYLHDVDAAERIGPRGLRPDALRERRVVLEGWSGCASRLFDELRARASEALLTSIAGADYGSDLAQHFAALDEICTSGLLPRRLRWHPGEVLALTRWSEGEQTDHLQRALACALLCIVPDANGDDALLTSGVILLDSCLALGEPLRSACVELFVWRAETSEDELDVLALLLILIGQAAIAPEDARLPALAETIGTPWRAEVRGSMRESLWHQLLARWLPRELEAALTSDGYA